MHFGHLLCFNVSMSVPLVSVIVPVYNVKQFLPESIESVINQTYRNLDILLVDDGSTDGSSEICDAYATKDSRIRVVHQENKGLSGARNAGLDIMNGDIVAFLDSDDAFHPEMIQLMVATMQRNGTDVVICRHSSCRTNKKMKHPRISSEKATLILYDRREALRALLSGKIDWYAWNKVYRRECFEAIRYPQGQVYEDIDTTYTILNSAKKVALIDAPLIMYRRRLESITEKYELRSAQDRIQSYVNIEKKVLENAPMIFGEQHLQWISRKRMKVLLETYARCGKKAKTYRSEILELGRKLELRKCDHRTKRLYFVFQISPKLFKVMYLTSLYVRRSFHAFIDGVVSLGGRT